MDGIEFEIPEFLERDILQLEKGIKENDSCVDCMYDELYASINAAMVNGIISTSDAAFLRKKYLGL
jgi:hypothetical protein